MKSLFLIIAGPTGSGKGYVQEYTQSYLAGTYDSSKKLNYALIDDYIETDPVYVYTSLNITKDIIDNNNELVMYISKLADIDNCMSEIKKNIGIDCQSNNNFRKLESTSTLYSSNYFNARRKYDKILNADIKIWLENRENIIFETTGAFNFDWLFTDEFISKDIRDDYKICLIYPYVNDEIILSRALHRYALYFNDYIKNIDNDTYANNIINGDNINGRIYKAPRYVRLTCDNYSLVNIIEKIQYNIAYYIDKCYVGGYHDLDMVIVYNNKKNVPIISLHTKCINGTNIKCASLSEILDLNMGKKLKTVLTNIKLECSQEKQDDLFYYNKYLKYKQKYLQAMHII